ncbi:hypothetical protein [Flavilitoribacter nigricans]|uniref:ParB/Sulfiredoxin domain-containing protein n=1 Tax=Flavilitoribacter nigricans (strain ATCC 23147 / DSM 23189 / NBRC 102662 / NCIMB 1420 / SS-2) TaxID=1122177 RepID=A0A2D0MZB3_FLAN2|nr:hypothetical protein [Flavilitoribacter nigricans]PHN01468.1 hypothetical protein CRP01_36820 [Flavilitoribacter nigricans DSM 23189 = NBRC 102662]
MKRKLTNRIDKVFQTLGLRTLYENKYGIKALNPVMKSVLLEAYQDRPYEMIDPGKLSLGVDGLKDRHTLLHVPLSDSPHFFLMTQFESQRAVDKSADYYKRSITGTLDLRRARIPDVSFKTYKERKAAILNDQYAPIFIVKNTPFHLIVDGKHRAALCLQLGKPVSAIFINDFFRDSHFYWLMQKMVNSTNTTAFEKHLTFFRTIFPT